MDPTQDQQQSTPKQQVTERLRQANNVLVTVPSNPSVDELAATIGLTLMLNKLDKHATAVFSGQVPSTLEFLRPEETIETNTDSLRDFIVSLDKNKADKLRYKVEENVVRIFITPYRTSITQDDLEFTQGDFNIDAVVALGVSQRDELDQVIIAHGRILHDATVIGVTAGQEISEIGQINWQEPAASSLCEMLVSISEALKGGLIDEQIATAFLTGIVAETERFSNPKTTPKVMTMAAQLMAAGANQQLIANELEKAVEVKMAAAGQDTAVPDNVAASDGTLSIPHVEEPKPLPTSEPQPESPQAESLPSPDTPAPPAQVESAESDQAQAGPLLPPSQTKSREFLSVKPDQKTDDGFYSPLYGDMPQQASSEQPPQTQPEPLQTSASAESTPPVPASQPEVQPDVPSSPASAPAPAPEQQPAPANESTAVLPAEPPQESILPPPPMPPSEPKPELDDGQIHIDTEGNILRKSAASPKHKTVEPLGNETDQDNGVESSGSNDNPIPGSTGADDVTLEDIEESVNSPHLAETQQAAGGLDNARSAVMDALAESQQNADSARTDLNALPLSAPVEQPSSYDTFRLGAHDAPVAPPAVDVSGNIPPDLSESAEDATNNIAPPPVPPPMFPRA